MLFNTSFNNISVISWRSVSLVEETEDPENTTDLSRVTDKLYHIMLYTSPSSRFELTTSMIIGTDCTGSCKSIYHTITATTPPLIFRGVYKPDICTKGGCCMVVWATYDICVYHHYSYQFIILVTYLHNWPIALQLGILIIMSSTFYFDKVVSSVVDSSFLHE
jgi:hypothetical protein